jgi:precorrin-8X/cobalt-precorrin-8 methylmutase
MSPIHPIEVESFRILHQRVDLSRFGAKAAAVVARVIHASADLEYAQAMVVAEEAVEAGVRALRRGAPVVVDVEMVRHGISTVPARCYLGETAAPEQPGLTRTAAAMRLAAERHPEGALVVVGCAPTALIEAIRLPWSPALVVGLPVGFVGAAEAKEALRASGLPSISNVGDKGGSAVAAGVVNALARLAANG